MNRDYVEQRDGGYWIAGTRVSLESIVRAFQDGLSPETIVAECFPILSLEQIYGAITFYLAHRAEIDAHLDTAETESSALRERLLNADPEFHHKLLQARRQLQLNQP